MNENINELVEKDQAATIPGHPEITVKPRPGHPEDPDLSSVKDNPQAARSLVEANDDQGEVLRSINLEAEVIACCEKYKGLVFAAKGKEVKPEDLEASLRELRDISNRYVGQINVADNTLQGVFTKYRIRLGFMFNAQKKIVEQTPGVLWTEYVDEHYDRRQLRSIQVCMRIANIPDSIPFAGLGMTRLLQIATVIEGRISKTTGLYLDDKPITHFLETHGGHYNPSDEVNIDEMKRETDITVGHEFIKSKDFGDYVTRTMVEELVDSKLDVGSDLVKRLSALKTLFGDDTENLKQKVSEYIEKAIAERKLDTVITPDGAAKSLDNTVKKLLEKASENMEKPEVYQKLDAVKISALMEKLQELAEKLPQQEETE